MPNNDGDKVKKCPFLNEYCIKEKCAIWAEMTRHQGGIGQKFGMCSFAGMMMILSEINQKTGTPVSKLIRG